MKKEIIIVALMAVTLMTVSATILMTIDPYELTLEVYDQTFQPGGLAAVTYERNLFALWVHLLWLETEQCPEGLEAMTKAGLDIFCTNLRDSS